MRWGRAGRHAVMELQLRCSFVWTHLFGREIVQAGWYSSLFTGEIYLPVFHSVSFILSAFFYR